MNKAKFIDFLDKNISEITEEKKMFAVRCLENDTEENQRMHQYYKKEYDASLIKLEIFRNLKAIVWRGDFKE